MDNLLSSLWSFHGCGCDLIIIDCNTQSDVTIGVLNFAYVMTHDRDRESRGSTLNVAIVYKAAASGPGSGFVERKPSPEPYQAVSKARLGSGF
jgi:hypothetical protein